jgi:hypothetical protein
MGCISHCDCDESEKIFFFFFVILIYLLKNVHKPKDEETLEAERGVPFSLFPGTRDGRAAGLNKEK